MGGTVVGPQNGRIQIVLELLQDTVDALSDELPPGLPTLTLVQHGPLTTIQLSPELIHSFGVGSTRHGGKILE